MNWPRLWRWFLIAVYLTLSPAGLIGGAYLIGTGVWLADNYPTNPEGNLNLIMGLYCQLAACLICSKAYALMNERDVGQAERERCMRICERMVLYTGLDCAEAIRELPPL